ncbi:MAG: cupin domain-containing protein [Nocardioidaceae bacterium]|nr:cupin domain-containing protein [Nocardioidaceae bacterium]
MVQRGGPQVLLRSHGHGHGHGHGSTVVLRRGAEEAHITRLAARAETGGQWAAFGEATQDPNFDNSAHTHDEAEAFYVLEGSYTFYTDAEPVEDVGPGTFVFIPPGAVHGFRAGSEGGKLLCLWPATVEEAFFERRTP